MKTSREDNNPKPKARGLEDKNSNRGSQRSERELMA